MKYLIASTAALLIATPNIAFAKEESAKSEDTEKVRCKYQKVLGSKIPEKVCRSESAWAEIERERIEQRRTDRTRNRNSGN